jgi:iron complex outermembrane receptor protein
VRYQSDYQTNINNDPRSVNDAYSIADLGFGVRDNQRPLPPELPREQPVRPLLHRQRERQRPVLPRRPDRDLAGITVNSWVPPRDVFRYFSVKLDVKF